MEPTPNKAKREDDDARIRWPLSPSPLLLSSRRRGTAQKISEVEISVHSISMAVPDFQSEPQSSAQGEQPVNLSTNPREVEEGKGGERCQTEREVEEGNPTQVERNGSGSRSSSSSGQWAGGVGVDDEMMIPPSLPPPPAGGRRSVGGSLELDQCRAV